MCKDNYEQSAFHVHVHGCSRLLHLIFMSSSDLHEKPPAKRRRLVQSHDSSRLPEMASTNPANDDHLREDEESEEDDLTTDTEVGQFGFVIVVSSVWLLMSALFVWVFRAGS